MVYCKTETNLCPPGPEMWECPTNKGSAAVLPRYSSAVCPTGVRCTSAVDMWSWAPPPFDMWVLAFMTGVAEKGLTRPIRHIGSSYASSLNDLRDRPFLL